MWAASATTPTRLRRLRPVVRRVVRVLVALVALVVRVDPVLVPEVVGLAARAAGTREPVARIFINLERRSPPGNFRLFGTRVVPTFNYFQTAAVLAAEGWLAAEGLKSREATKLAGETESELSIRAPSQATPA